MRLAVSGLAKSYAGPVLQGIELSVAAGEVRGIVGENGAGKSTLFNIVVGLVPRDADTILLDDADHAPASARAAQRAGAAIATQELSLVETLDVAENLLLRALPARFGLIRRRDAVARADALIAALGLRGVTPATPLAALSLAERQMIEFGKAIAAPARLLILDEPTAALSSDQADRLHRLMRGRAAEGTAILYASHRLEDVRRVCDNVSVMRNGRIVLTGPAGALDAPAMIEAMSGRTLARHAGRPRRAPGPALLAAEGIRTRDLPHPIDLELRAGEVVGLAGLAGAGRTELIEALFGLTPLRAGRVVRVEGERRTAIASPRQATRSGMGLVSEDRRRSGIFAGQSVAFNAAVAALPRRLFVDRRGIEAATREMVATLGVRCAGVSQDIAALSGGNQQKILFGRWLMTGARVLLLDEPGRGVDVAARHDIHGEVRRLADAGAAILVASSELEELTALCDRILVLSGRRLVAEFVAPDWSEDAILAAAFSAHLAGDRDAEPALEGSQ